MQHATVARRAGRTTCSALGGIALATLARTQFAALVLVLALAVLAHELAYAEPGARRRDRVWSAARNAVSHHRVLAAVYALGAVAAVVLVAAGRFSDTLGTYAAAVEGNLFPHHFVPSLAEHLAMIALGLGVLPFLVGAAWLAGNLVGASTRERQAFAALGSRDDPRARGRGDVVRPPLRRRRRPRPLPLLRRPGACSSRSRPRAPTGAGRAGRCSCRSSSSRTASRRPACRGSTKLNVDTPVSVLDDKVLAVAHTLGRAQAALIVGTILLAALFLEAAHLLRRSYVAAVLAVLTAFALPAETAYAFSRLFAVNGTSGRPLTLDQGVVFDWLDRTLGTRAERRRWCRTRSTTPTTGRASAGGGTSSSGTSR